MTGTLTWLKEELCKHLRFHCSCCKIRRNDRNGDTGSGPYVALVTANAQGRAWEQSKHQESLPSTPSPQSLTTSGPLPPQGCPGKTTQRLFHQPMRYFGWLHISVISEGHCPICHILTARDIPRRGWRSLQLPSLVEQLPTPRLSLSSVLWNTRSLLKITYKQSSPGIFHCSLTVFRYLHPHLTAQNKHLSQYERQILLGTLRATLNYQGSQTSAESRTGARQNANWSPQNSVHSPIYSWVTET